MSGFAILIFLTSLAFFLQGLEKPLFYYYETYSYISIILSTAIEILFLGELTTQIKTKFSILNANICLETVILQNKHRKVHPISELRFQNVNPFASKIITLLEVHHELSATSRKLNNIFGFPALITTAINFYIATTSLYYPLQLFSSQKSVFNVFQHIMSSLWCFIMLIEISILVSCFENVCQEVKAD